MRKSFAVLLVALSFLLLPACDNSTLFPQQPTSESASVGGNDYDGEHVDADNNGVCDDCHEKVTVTFDVFGINDLHGKFLDTDPQPGVDEMSTYLANAKKNNENTIILSSGDMWQGSPESNLTKGAIVTDWMNEMGFASMTLGNHEYDWGEEAIANNAKLAKFPFLGINVFDTDTNERAEYCAPSVMVEKNGVKIGIIGAEGNVYSSISGDRREGVRFLTGDLLTDLVKEESTKLRNEGADCIIYSIHDGTTSDYDHYDDELSNGYVDIVFEAHTHQSYTTKDKYGVYHVQGGGDNKRGLSHAEIEINYVTSTATVNKAGQVQHSSYTQLEDHPVVKTLETKYSQQIALAYEVVGTTTKRLVDSDILPVCAEQYYKVGQEKWGKDYKIVLGGGHMKLRSPYALEPGDITYGDIMNILPFDNELVLGAISGVHLKERFINNNSYWLYYSDYGNSIKNNIQLNETYYIIVDRYTSTFASNNITEVAFYDSNVFPRDLYADYHREKKDDVVVRDVAEHISIERALEIADALPSNGESDERYRVYGEILNIDPPHSSGKHYGNLTISDGKGNTIYVYGTYTASGVLYGDMTEKPQVGDTVVLESTLKKFVNGAGAVKLELTKGTLISTLTDISEVLEIGRGLQPNGETTEKYAVRGKVIDIENAYGNMTIIDDEGTELYIYGPRDEKGNPYDAFPAVGDTVIYQGVIKRYINSSNQEKIELFHPVIVWTGVEVDEE